MTSRDTGFIEFRGREDWWQADAVTVALIEAAPIPRTNPNPPDWAIRMVEDMARQYAATALCLSEDIKHAKAA